MGRRVQGWMESTRWVAGSKGPRVDGISKVGVWVVGSKGGWDQQGG